MARPGSNDDPVTSYATAVVQKRLVAGPKIVQACERHLDDLNQAKSRGLTFDLYAVHHHIAFFERYLRHYKGGFAQKPFLLSPWQKFVQGSIFGWRKENGFRRYRSAHVELPKKNGKTPMAAGTGLYGLVADGEPGANIYSAATAKNQARLIFNDASAFVQTSPDLKRKIRRLQTALVVPETFSAFRCLSRESKSEDGIDPHYGLVDELHRHKNRDLLDLLKNSFATRRQPLLFIITTAGEDDAASPYTAERLYAEQVVKADLADDTHFVFIADADADADPFDPVTWQQANPNLGVSITLEDMTKLAMGAKNSPIELGAFKRLRLDIITSTIASIVPSEVWRANDGAPIDEATLEGRQCWAGLDLSTKIDLTAFVMVFPPRTDGERYVIVPRFWLPGDNVARLAARDRVPYQQWIDEGLVRTTGGEILDHRAVRDQILADAARFQIQEIAFDPFGATEIISDLLDEGVPCVEFRQGHLSYAVPTREFMEQAIALRFAHGNNPVLTWMNSNARAITDRNLNMMPSKKHSRGRIDGIVALVMGLGRLLRGAATDERSPWDDPTFSIAAPPT